MVESADLTSSNNCVIDVTTKHSSKKCSNNRKLLSLFINNAMNFTKQFHSRKIKIIPAICICFLGVSSWIDVNAIWSQASVLSTNLIEKEKSLSIITIIIQCANISTILYTILRHKFPYFFTKYKHIFIIVIILTDFVCLFSLSFSWKNYVFFGDQPLSLPIYLFFFLMAFVDCLSSVIYMPYVSNYSSSYISPFFLGQTLSNLIPSSLKLLQGQTFENVTNPITGVFEFKLNGKLMSTQSYLLIICLILLFSLLFFILIHWKYFNSSSNLNLGPDELDITLKLPYSLLNTYIIVFIYAAISNGMLPQLLFYSTTRYSFITMDYANNLSSIFGSLVAIFMTCIKIKSLFLTKIILILYAAITSYIFYVALTGPVFGLNYGSFFIITSFVTCSIVSSVSRHLLCNHCFQNGENALFWMGIFTQIGSLIGTFVMFFPVFIYNVFQTK